MNVIDAAAGVILVAREVDALLQRDGDYLMRWHELIEMAPRLREALERLDAAEPVKVV